MTPVSDAKPRTHRNRFLAVSGMVLVGVVVFVSLFGPLIVSQDPQGMDLQNRLKGPSSAHLMGTDEFGRDLWARVATGARISLGVGLVVVIIASVLGTLIGAFSGYAGGTVDEVVMRITDVFLAFPSLILAMAVAATLGASIMHAMAAIALTWWPTYARLVRVQTLVIRELNYVQAARLAGMSGPAIVFRHIIPNALGPVFVRATLDMGFAILTAASLGFVGLGAQPPQPEWGLMVSIGRHYFPASWWYPTFPGLAIFATVLGFNLIGDTLRDLFDPKS